MAAAQVIAAHFGDPSWLEVERQGPLPWLGPRANLEIVVVDQEGRPVPGLWCEFAAEDPEAASTAEEIFGTDDDGHCVIPNIPAVAYRITLNQLVEDDHYEPIKEFRLELVPGAPPALVTVEMP